MNNYSDFTKLLSDIGFNQFYLQDISQARHIINYGDKKGVKDLLSIQDAARQYTYDDTTKYSVKIDRQLSILNNGPEINDHELILQCIEVFDWGNVQSSNIINAINLHRQKKLRSYLLECKSWFEDDNSLYPPEFTELFWSSGWTKVYSFMFEKTTIYDSRVAAFINMLLIQFHHQLNCETQKARLYQVSNKLISVGNPKSRKRCPASTDRRTMGIKLQPKVEKSFIANKLASWILRYITELEFGSCSQQNFREIDKAAFMLGFDMDQIAPELKFT